MCYQSIKMLKLLINDVLILLIDVLLKLLIDDVLKLLISVNTILIL